jgi:hypothetical protein
MLAVDQCATKKPGIPCVDCAKSSKGLMSMAKAICQRGSPFAYSSIDGMPSAIPHIWQIDTDCKVCRYAYPSWGVDFNVEIPSSANTLDASVSVNDESGCSETLSIKLHFRDTLDLTNSQQEAVTRLLGLNGCGEDFLDKVAFLDEDDAALTTRLEQWSMEYASSLCIIDSKNLCTTSPPFPVSSYVFARSYLTANLPAVLTISHTQVNTS